jgi:hypothetical protein
MEDDMTASERPEASPRRRWLLIGLGVASLVALLVALLIDRSSDDDEETVGSTTTETTAASTTTEPETTTSTTTTVVLDTSTAVWPTVASGITYDDPVAAARGFAVDFVGFDDPVVGEFQQGDSRSGEVEVRPTADGPVTTVLVRQLSGSEQWWVLGAATANIVVTEPETGAAIASPVRLQGTSTAFEANVAVALYEDDTASPIGTGFVMGGSMGELGPFDGSLEFAAPSSSHGALVFTTSSMEDGSIWEASVLRVAFDR